MNRITMNGSVLWIKMSYQFDTNLTLHNCQSNASCIMHNVECLFRYLVRLCLEPRLELR